MRLSARGQSPTRPGALLSSAPRPDAFHRQALGQRTGSCASLRPTQMRWGDSVEEEAAEGEAEVYEVLPETQVRRHGAARGATLLAAAAALAALDRPRHAARRPSGSPTLKPGRL